MALLLSSLPIEILLEIISFLSPRSVLSLGQTSRFFHALSINDFVWHHLLSPLPLDIWDIDLEVDILNVSGLELLESHVRALRVEHNWQKRRSRPKQLASVFHGHTVFHMQFVTHAWLLTLSRKPNMVYLSVYHVADLHLPRRNAVLEVPYASRFSAVLQKGGKQIIVAIISGLEVQNTQSMLSVYAIPLHLDADGDTDASRSRVTSSIFRQRLHGTVSEIHAFGRFIAAAIAQFKTLVDPPTYELLLIDVASGAQLLVDPQIPDDIAQMQFRIGPKHLVVSFVRNKRIVLRVLNSERILQALTNNELRHCNVPQVAEILAEFETAPTAVHFCFTSAENLGLHLHKIVTLCFPAPSDVGSIASVFSFPLSGNLSALQHTSFPTPAHGSIEMICVGDSGHRAVWLQHDWETETYTLMKAIFGEAGSVQPLLDVDLALPFETSACRALAFHESTGRVCVALHTGELYFLRF